MLESAKGEVLGSAVVGERGQVVIPADVRKMFKVKPGDRLIVVAYPGNKIGLIPAANFNKFLNQTT